MTREDLLLLMYQRSTGTGYVVHCDNYELKFVNPPLLRLIGQPFDTWQGKICYEFLYGRTEPCSTCKMHKTKLGQTTRWYHESSFSKRPLLMRDFKIEVEGEELFLPTAYNIPKEMEELQLLTATMTSEQLLTACAKTLLRGQGATEVFLEEITRFYGGTGGFFFYQDLDRPTFSLRHQYSSNRKDQWDGTEEQRSFAFSPEDGWVKYLTDHTYLLLEPENMGTFPAPIQVFSAQPLLLTHVRMGEKVVGVLGIQNVTENQEEFHLIPTIVGFLRNYFAGKETVLALEAQKEACETVLACVNNLVTEENLEQGIQHLLEELTQYFQADRGLLLKNNHGLVEINQAFNRGEVALPAVHFREDSLGKMDRWFDQFGEKNTLYIRDFQAEVGKIAPEMAADLQQDGVDRMLGIRLRDQGKTTYFLMVDNPGFHPKNNTVLQSIAQFVESYLDKDLLLKKLSELSYTDSLTGLYNRNFYNSYLEHAQEKVENGGKIHGLGVLYADVNGLKKANDNFGHELGDILLKWSAKFLKEEVGGVVFRLGGDEFLCLLEGFTLTEFQEKQREIQEKLEKYGEKHLSLGWYHQTETLSVAQGVQEADGEMYQAKQNFYQEQAQDVRSVREALADFEKNVSALALEL